MKLNNIIFYDDLMHSSEAILLKKELSKHFNLVVVDHYLIDFFLNMMDSNQNEDFRNLYVAYQNIEFKQKRISNIVNWLACRYSPVAVVFGFNGFVYESMMSNSFKTIGIKTISVAHSGLGHIKNFDGIATNDDYLLCWNEFDKAALAKSEDLESCKIVDVGALKYLKDYEDYDNGPKHKIEKFSNNILICTSTINTGLSLVISDPKKHQKNLKQLGLWAKKRSNKTFYIKCHPSYDYYSYYEYLYLNISNIKIVRSNNDIKNIKFDLAIAMNYCTTYLLDLMLKRIPVVLYEEAIYSTDGSRNILPDNIIKRVKEFNELRDLIDDINTLNHILLSQDFHIKSIINIKDISNLILDIKKSAAKNNDRLKINSSLDRLFVVLFKFNILIFFIRSLRRSKIKFDDYLYFINIYQQGLIKKIVLKFLMIPYAFRNTRNKRLIKERLRKPK